MINNLMARSYKTIEEAHLKASIGTVAMLQGKSGHKLVLVAYVGADAAPAARHGRRRPAELTGRRARCRWRRLRRLCLRDRRRGRHDVLHVLHLLEPLNVLLAAGRGYGAAAVDDDVAVAAAHAAHRGSGALPARRRGRPPLHQVRAAVVAVRQLVLVVEVAGQRLVRALRRLDLGEERLLLL